MSARIALICVRGFGIPRLLDRAAQLLPPDLAWAVVHVVDQRPEEEVERAIGNLPGRRGGLDRMHQSTDQLQQDVQHEIESWLREAGRTAELSFLYGIPEQEIVGLASQIDAEIVAIGARPAIGPDRFGHVSRFIIDHATCSVLVIAAEDGS
jgi:nucleotide-binding universal stress UspA family protein